MRRFIDASPVPVKFGTSERIVAGKVSGKLSAVSLVNSHEVAVEPEQQSGAIVRDVFLETSKVCEACSGAIIADLQQHLDSQSA
ncbi:MAG: hypothetical protein OET63_10975 [Desulfobacterales bacterium]|jgi:hypothetical protein|nr:hypothetical protein [Desulfobacterales bacterium]